MPAPRKYNDELRERAVRTVHETIKENPRIPVKRACNQVGEQLGIPGSTLRNWFRAPGPVPGRRRRRPTRMRGSCSWRGRTGNCASRTRS